MPHRLIGKNILTNYNFYIVPDNTDLAEDAHNGHGILYVHLHSFYKHSLTHEFIDTAPTTFEHTASLVIVVG